MTPEDAIRYYGTDTHKSGAVERIATVLGCSMSSVWEWIDRGSIPDGRQYQLELATKGKLKADQPAARV
jgi:hypothetical protein